MCYFCNKISLLHANFSLSVNFCVLTDSNRCMDAAWTTWTFHCGVFVTGRSYGSVQEIENFNSSIFSEFNFSHPVIEDYAIAKSLCGMRTAPVYSAMFLCYFYPVILDINPMITSEK